MTHINDIKKQQPSYVTGGTVNGPTHLGKLKLTVGLSHFTLRSLPKIHETMFLKRSMPMSTAELILKVKAGNNAYAYQ